MDNIIYESNIVKDNYTEYVCEKYDIQDKDKSVTTIPMIDVNDLDKFKWNIGLVCGNSGSGKTSILNNIGKIQVPSYDMNKSIISQFSSLSEQGACDLLCGVGLSSIPLWLHKVNELSNGERSRLDLAWQLYQGKENGIILIDEYSSVVNRFCAKSMSHALQRYVRNNNMKIILGSCHFDIIEWLKPDWVFNLNKASNGLVYIERLIYKDDDEYKLYSNINSNDALTKKYDL